MVKYLLLWASVVAQSLKNLPAGQETWVGSLGWEDPLEKEMATHSSILAWRIPWTEKPGRLKSMGSTKSWTQQLKVRVWQKHLPCLEMVVNPHSACHVE